MSYKQRFPYIKQVWYIVKFKIKKFLSKERYIYGERNEL